MFLHKAALRPVPPYAVVPDHSVSNLEQQLGRQNDALVHLLEHGYRELDRRQPELGEWLTGEVSGRSDQVVQSLGYFLGVTVFLAFREAFPNRMTEIDRAALHIASETLATDEALRAEDRRDAMQGDSMLPNSGALLNGGALFAGSVAPVPGDLLGSDDPFTELPTPQGAADLKVGAEPGGAASQAEADLTKDRARLPLEAPPFEDDGLWLDEDLIGEEDPLSNSGPMNDDGLLGDDGVRSDDVLAARQPALLDFIQFHVREAVSQAAGRINMQELDEVYRAILVEVIALSDAVHPPHAGRPN